MSQLCQAMTKNERPPCSLFVSVELTMNHQQQIDDKTILFDCVVLLIETT